MRVTRTGPKTLARPRPLPGPGAAVRYPRGAGDLRDAFLPRGIQVGRGLQQPPLQLAALGPDHVLPLPVVAEPRLVRSPGQQPGELLRGIGQGRRQLPSAGASLPSSRTCLTVTGTVTATAVPPMLAGSGCEGAGAGVLVPVKKPRDGEPDIDTKTRNALLRGARYQGERAFALMSQRWRAVQHVSVDPSQIGDIAKAVLVLTQIEHKMIS